MYVLLCSYSLKWTATAAVHVDWRATYISVCGNGQSTLLHKSHIWMLWKLRSIVFYHQYGQGKNLQLGKTDKAFRCSSFDNILLLYLNMKRYNGRW